MRFLRPTALSRMLMLWAFFCAGVSGAGEIEIKLDALVDNGGYVITKNGRAIAQLNKNRLFIPASTIKIATSLMALEVLGPSHRINTEFYLRNDKILCIKGYGDPYLLSERVQEIAAGLRQRGLSQVESLILDNSFFALKEPVDGAENSANPYDAENMALAVNFNSVALIKYQTGIVDSPEPQTPVLNIAKDIGALIDPGLHRVNVSAYQRRDARITAQRYTAELFAEQLRRQGIAVGTGYRSGKVAAGDALLYTYRSKMTVAEMISGCLKYSNNYIANQLFLLCGAARFGPPATWKKAQQAMAETLSSAAGLSSRDIIVVEGSGLSRKNLATPAAMITLLVRFKPHAELLSKTGNTPLKSGTMTGVYGYAGYFDQTGALDPFVILLNQESNTRDQLLTLASALHHQAKQTPAQ